MLRSLIIALLVSLVLWFLTFNFFFSHSNWPISLVIAVAAGVIAFLLLRAWTKHRQLTAPPPIWEFVFPVVVVTLLFFAARQFLPAPGDCVTEQTINISCGPVSIVPSEEDVCVKKRGKITWKLPAGTAVKIYELKEQVVFWWKDADPIPFAPPQAEYEDTNEIRVTVRDYGGYYKYSVSCLDGTTNKLDPMVEVPPR